MTDFRLPKQVENDAASAGLASALSERTEPLWSRGEFGAVRARLDFELRATLQRVFATGRIVRGIDAAEKVLAGEQRGLERVDRTTGVDRGGRISRLLVLADDGSERFYRSVDFLLRRHAPRVLALRLDVAHDELGSLFGQGELARLLLIQHKDAVGAVLLALAATWRSSQA